MKVVTIIFFCISFVSFSQTENDSIYRFVEQEAEFPGGFKEMKLFISKNLIFPPTMGCVAGNVVIRFIVEKDGSLSEIIVIKSIPECDEEALKVVRQMPNWIPAKNNGEAIRSYHYIPVAFKLH